MNDYFKKKNLGFKKFEFDFDQKRSNRPQKTYYSKKQNAGAFDFIELIQSWEQIIGPNFSKKTVPLKHKGGCLTILTEHSSFSDQLKFLERPIIKKIEKFFPVFEGKIKKINFYSNSVFFKEKKTQLTKIVAQKSVSKAPQLHPQSPEYHALKKSAQEQLGNFDDPDVMNSLESIFIQMKLRDKE